VAVSDALDAPFEQRDSARHRVAELELLLAAARDLIGDIPLNVWKHDERQLLLRGIAAAMNRNAKPGGADPGT
jgi:hypothetical protein